MFSKEQYKLFVEIYERYNLSEDEPSMVDVVDDINYLLDRLGIDACMYQVLKEEEEKTNFDVPSR